MPEFSWLIAASVLGAYLLIDWLYTEYTIAIVELRKLKAANIGAFMYMLLAYGVVNYVGDWRYVIPMMIGSWLGIYLSIWRKERA
jgi:hypothetical protein